MCPLVGYSKPSSSFTVVDLPIHGSQKPENLTAVDVEIHAIHRPRLWPPPEI